MLVLLAVGLAFADASVVALALPDLYLSFDASIEGVSWVLTSYALAVALAGLVGLVAFRRVRPVVAATTGLALFAAASVACGVAPSLPTLLAARVAQGAGAAALLAGSVPLLVALVGDATRAGHRWATAGTVGAAVGPAIGGLVTQVLDWRAVFLAQAPLAIAALAAVAVAATRGWVAWAPSTEGAEARRRPAGAMVADVGFLFTFGALVGALFLGVLLLVVVWSLEPIVAAVVVTALPVGAAMARPLGRVLTSPQRAVAGAALLSGGLAGLALLPAVDARWAAAALGLCGLGFGLLANLLGPLAVPPGSGIRAATLSSSLRHFGLVLGLVVIAPLLGSSILDAAETAPLQATATMLDAPTPGLTKVRIALDLRDAVEEAPEGQAPDLDAIFAANGADDDERVATLRDDLVDGIARVITRAFRPGFTAAAVLAALAVVPALLALARSRQRHHEPPAGPGWLIVAALGAAAVALPLAAGPAGAGEMGRYEPADPCTAPADPFSGDGLDATVQRLVLSGLNGAACKLGVSREALVLSLDEASGVDDVAWDRTTIEDALRAGLGRAIDDADERDSLPGWIATALGWAVERAPVSWFLEQLGVD